MNRKGSFVRQLARLHKHVTFNVSDYASRSAKKKNIGMGVFANLSVIFPMRSYSEPPHWFHRFVESVASAMRFIKKGSARRKKSSAATHGADLSTVSMKALSLLSKQEPGRPPGGQRQQWGAELFGSYL